MLILIDIEFFDNWRHANATSPNHCGRLNLISNSVVFKRNRLLINLHDPRFGVYLNAGLLKRVFNVLAHLFPHTGHDSIAHLY